MPRPRGMCRAPNCMLCMGYHLKQSVHGWPTCVCGHTELIHEKPEEETKETTTDAD